MKEMAQKFPDLCNPGIGASARLLNLGADLNMNQNGVEGSNTLDNGTVSVTATANCPLAMGSCKD